MHMKSLLSSSLSHLSSQLWKFPVPETFELEKVYSMAELDPSDLVIDDAKEWLGRGYHSLLQFLPVFPQIDIKFKYNGGIYYQI